MSYEAALASTGMVGGSNTIHLSALGDPQAAGLPVNLVGLMPSGIYFIPEPSTVALGLIGAAVLALRGRR